MYGLLFVVGGSTQVIFSRGLYTSHLYLLEHEKRKTVTLRFSSFFNHKRDRRMAAHACAADISAQAEMSRNGKYISALRRDE